MTGPPPIICLMGPTAAGKTDVAVALVERLPLSIISVDSAMVYRGLDIGSGKPGPEVLRRAPHRLVDIREPEHPYSAAEFRRDALVAIDEVHREGRTPLLVGGTGLYFRALRQGLSPLPSAVPALRSRLEAEARAVGWAALHERLERVDPEAAARIHPNDAQRIQRALEVCELTGRPMSAQRGKAARRALPYPVIAVSVEPSDRARLHQAIEARFHAMLEAGLVEEVEALRRRPGLHRDLPSMRSVGYRQVWDHLDGACDRAQMVDRAVAATRQLARRQLTWLRGETGVARFDSLSGDRVTRLETFVSRALDARGGDHWDGPRENEL